MTGDIDFAAHIYAKIKKTKSPSTLTFSKVNCRLLCNEYANFKYISGSPRPMQIISSKSTISSLHIVPLSVDCCNKYFFQIIKK